jgi:hypothetical protein
MIIFSGCCPKIQNKYIQVNNTVYKEKIIEIPKICPAVINNFSENPILEKKFNLMIARLDYCNEKLTLCLDKNILH